MLSEQHRQRVARGRQRGLLPLPILLLLLEIGELQLGVLTPHGVFLRLLLVLKEVRKPCEPGHFSPHIVKPYEFPPPE
ncbi:hypothetical protein [Burkholderia ambifaria]|uniref:hypothetical protein n=1 Tax=Burkholderia ambifaria TaxID=152480 RepID=UPI001C93579A|nr:hypothetical protein [Burkholderia ambifaria]MBY4771776.1 hypothetical protein [Burkholderia ambifaria]